METGEQVRPHSHTSIVQGIIVRPVKPAERLRWDQLVRQYHYLGFKGMVGKTMRYVAEFQGCWFALLGWQAAAFKCSPRDQWIGWSQLTRLQRLHLIANNSRFLILPGQQIPNLASRILSLNLKRLSADWLKIYGHPVLLAETFVDTARFTGACYRAANWLPIGQTRGFAKVHGSYVYHGRPKQILMYPLHRCSKKRLADPRPHHSWRWPMQVCSLSNKQMNQLILIIRGIPDFRRTQGRRHPMFSVLAIAIAAILGGATTYTAIGEWVGRLTQNQLKRLRTWYDRKQKKHVPPSEATIRRVLQGADVDILDQRLGQWLFGVSNEKELAVDGKCLRGAGIQLLSAFLHQQGVTIAQVEVSDKTNEIPMLPVLLKELDIKGGVVTADALHTQVKTAQYIVEDKKADYLFIVKDNQKNLRNDIATLGDDDFSPSVHYHRQRSRSD